MEVNCWNSFFQNNFGSLIFLRGCLSRIIYSGFSVVGFFAIFAFYSIGSGYWKLIGFWVIIAVKHKPGYWFFLVFQELDFLILKLILNVVYHFKNRSWLILDFYGFTRFWIEIFEWFIRIWIWLIINSINQLLIQISHALLF